MTEQEEHQKYLDSAIHPDEYRRIKELPGFDKRIWEWSPNDDRYYNIEDELRRKGKI